MEYPQGMPEVGKGDCIILSKGIYNFVQAARHYYKKAVEVLKKLGFIQGNVDPCLNVKKCKKGIVCDPLYVDDNFMIKDSKAISDAIKALKENGLVLKIMEGLHDYLFFEVKFSTDKKRA